MVAAIPTLAKVVVGRRYPEPRKEAGPEDIDNRDLHLQRWVMVLVFTDRWVRVCVYTPYLTIILK
jgi:hypothetical protein